MLEKRPWLATLLEVAVALVVSAVFITLALQTSVNPMDRMGQVSGVAALDFRFLVAGLVILGGLAIASRWRGGAKFELATRLACAAVASLASAMVAGGVAIALHGTKFGLAGDLGDNSVFLFWIELLDHGHKISEVYPPLQVYLMKWTASLLGTDPAYAIKWVQIVGVGAIGPAAYFCWRLLLRPVWALGIGVVAAIPLFEAFRPYPPLVLVIFIPVAVKFLEVMRDAPELTLRRLALLGLAFGCVFGVLCLLYSGWFQWSALGVLFTTAVVFPWRREPAKAAMLCALAACSFLLLTHNYFANVLGAGGIKDAYTYFDTTVDPGYVTMWRGGLPGPVANGVWPPPGELGGVGAFTLLLAIGLGVAVALGRKRLPVTAVGAMLAGALFMRFYYARLMWKTKLVQLYPRTTGEIVYCLLLLCGFAVMLVVERLRERSGESTAHGGVIGSIAALLLVFGTAGSSISDRYMPKNVQDDTRWLAYWAHEAVPLDKNQARRGKVVPSSSLESDQFWNDALVDEHPETAFSSAVGPDPAREEWVEVDIPNARTFHKIVLVPAADGFPVDFTLEVWDGQKWLVRVAKTGYPAPRPGEPQVFELGRDVTDRVRLHATKLGVTPEGAALRLAEFQLFR